MLEMDTDVVKGIMFIHLIGELNRDTILQFDNELNYLLLHEKVPTGVLIYETNSDNTSQGLIKGKEIKKYRLRVWLSDSYPLSADETEYFNMKLHVKVN